MRNAIWMLVLILFVGLAVGVWWTVRSLDGLVARAIEHYGSELTGTEVAVGSVNIELTEGRGAVDRVTIANPSGFSSERAVSLGHGSIVIDPTAATRTLIEIDEITMSGSRLVLELDERGRSNLATLKKHIESATANASTSTDAPRLRVGTLQFEDGVVVVDATALGGERMERNLPTVRLSNLGGVNGAPPAEIGRAALVALLDHAAREAVTDELRNRLQAELEERGGEAGAAVGRLLGAIGD